MPKYIKIKTVRLKSDKNYPNLSILKTLIHMQKITTWVSYETGKLRVSSEFWSVKKGPNQMEPQEEEKRNEKWNEKFGEWKQSQ